MTAFRKTFDGKLPSVNASIDAMPGSLEQSAPGLSKAKLKRFFQRFSLLLGRLDKNGARHPQYLQYGGQPVPEYLNTIVDQAMSYMASGASTFAQNSLHTLVLLQDSLEKAVGTDVDQLKSLSSTVAADLGTSVQQSDELLEKLREQVRQAEAARESVTANQAAIQAALEQSNDNATKVTAARRSVEQLTSPDGRNKTSLEALARRARELISEIDKASATAAELSQSASTENEGAKKARGAADGLVQELITIRDQAQQVLSLSSQAGLAASYKSEGKALELKSHIFTGVLYTSVLITLGVAAYYVLPGLQQALAHDNRANVTQALFATLIRATVLAPLVYMIYFTSRRITALETLRMDYAEKAAASLAYSGYREQMTNDEDLLRQLKGSLLSKFHEHPERLLRPGSTSTSAKVKTPGFEAETRVNMGEGKNPVDDGELQG